jgi:hypothetical protein
MQYQELRAKQTCKRPIIFVAHRLGGSIVESVGALSTASEARSYCTLVVVAWLVAVGVSLAAQRRPVPPVPPPWRQPCACDISGLGGEGGFGSKAAGGRGGRRQTMRGLRWPSSLFVAHLRKAAIGANVAHERDRVELLLPCACTHALLRHLLSRFIAGRSGLELNRWTLWGSSSQPLDQGGACGMRRVLRSRRLVVAAVASRRYMCAVQQLGGESAVSSRAVLKRRARHSRLHEWAAALSSTLLVSA